jgi:RNAse (barnase) inhibitor barstar
MSARSRVAKPVEALPAQTVRRLADFGVDDLRRWALLSGHEFVLADCSDCVGRQAVLTAIGRAFAFPDWYGANLDALYDCLTDLPDRGAPGWIVVLARLPDAPGFGAEDRAALLDVFRDAAEEFARRRVGLRVFFS